ncbi:MAG: Rab family GTPase [Cyclobacteriaceae bacterium]
MQISKKVILVGNFGVGKTSLVSRYVHQKFSDQYLTTIGVKVDKKVVNVEGTEMSLILWDIAGESSATKIPKAYTMGAHGIIYVFDVNRPETYENLSMDIFELQKNLKDPALVVLGNKSDLADDYLIEKIKVDTQREILFTSAKTGVNVDQAFQNIAKQLL